MKQPKSKLEKFRSEVLQLKKAAIDLTIQTVQSHNSRMCNRIA